IDMPPGSYAVEFRWETAPVEAPPPVEVPVAVLDLPAAEPVREARVADVPILPATLRPRTFPHCAMASAITALMLGGAAAAWRWWPAAPSSVDAKSAPNGSPGVPAPLSSGGFRMIAGAVAPYVDRNGRTWGPDRFATGGNVLARPSERIYRTLDPDIFRHL